MSLRALPNIISVARLGLVVPVVWALSTAQFEFALWLFLVAGVSDALDGILAKRFGWQSRLGAVLDPAADKALIVACFFTLGWLNMLPWWLVGTVFARDLIIVVWIALHHYLLENVEVVPSVLSKINTFAQIVCVLLVVYATGGALHHAFIEMWTVITLLTTVFSGLQYLSVWSRRAVGLRRAPR